MAKGKVDDLEQSPDAPAEPVEIDETTVDAITDPAPEDGVAVDAEGGAAEDGEAEEVDPRFAGLGEEVWLVYDGDATKMTYGSIELLPGVPTKVSRDEAEGILTHPFESVVIVDPPVEDEEPASAAE